MQPDANMPRALIHLNDEAGVDQYSVELEGAIGDWLESFLTRDAAERYISECRLAHSPDTDFRDTRASGAGQPVPKIAGAPEPLKHADEKFVSMSGLALAAQVMKTMARNSPQWSAAEQEAIAFALDELVGWAQRSAAPGLPWMPVSEPPALTDQAYGWPMSAPVLGLLEGGVMAVVTYEHYDAPDCTPTWMTTCSERWNVTGRVRLWQPLVPPELPAAAAATGT